MSFRNWYIDNKLRMNALECNEHEWRWMVLNCHVMTYKLIKHDILTGVDFMVHVIPWLEQIIVISQLTSGELLTCLKILPQKKDFISKKDSKKGVGKWVFLLGRPPGRCYVSFWECTKKYALVHLKKDIEEQFHLKYFLGNKISSKLPETGFVSFFFSSPRGAIFRGLCFNGPEAVGCRTCRIAVKSTYGWSIGAAWQMFRRGWVDLGWLSGVFL